MGDMTVDELKDKKLWFLWSAKPGRNGKVTKVPFAANGGATGTDDAHKGTWVSFDDAESARNQFQASGLGLKIPKGFFLLDIDHKDISDPFAQLMLSRFSSYAEVSPSGKGIHIIGQCDITKLPVHFDDRRKRLVLDSEYYKYNHMVGRYNDIYRVQIPDHQSSQQWKDRCRSVIRSWIYSLSEIFPYKESRWKL